MKLTDLEALEKLQRSRSFRVRFFRDGTEDHLPPSDGPGVSLERACKLADRLHAVSVLGHVTMVAVIGPDMRPVFAANPVPTIPTIPPMTPEAPPMRVSRRAFALAESEGIDLDILVNPDALETVLTDAILVREAT